MSNETKIGILTIVTIALAFWGFKFIQGKNILKTSNIYYVTYNDVNRLKISTPVLINGYQIGIVSTIEMEPTNYESILVTLDLDKGLRIPKNTTATIISTGFMGGQAVVLDFPGPCSGEDCAQSGDYLHGVTKGLLSSMVGEETLEGYVGIVESGLKSLIDTLDNRLLSENSDHLIAKSVQDLQTTMANLKSTTTQLDGLLRRSSGNINSTFANLKTLTDTIQASSAQIKSIIANVDNLSNDLAEVDLGKTMEDVDATVASLQNTLKSADVAMGNVNTVLGKINAGEGTLGKLLHDEELYYQLSNLSSQTDSLVNDLQVRPYRYIPFKGRKRVKRYDRKDAKEEEMEGVGGK